MRQGAVHVSHNQAVVEWVDALPPRSFFQTGNVPGPARAIETALSRLAAQGDGPIDRVRHGLYWRRPKPTRFGTGRPDPLAAAMAVAGHGAGPAGWSATQALGLTTQVPALPTIAVIRRPPKGFPGVRFVSRSNIDRYTLNPTEVAVLEALRDFPAHLDPSLGLTDLTERVHQLVTDGRLNARKVLVAADSERHAGLGLAAHATLDELIDG
jgi:hypothetical protein